MNQGRVDRDLGGFWRRCLIASATLIGTVALLWFIWAVGTALLILFSAFLAAIALDTPARVLAKISGLSRRAGVIGVIIIVLLLIISASTLGTFNISSQGPQLRAQITKSVDSLKDKLEQYPITQHLFSGSSSKTSSAYPQIGQRLTKELPGALTVTLSSLTDLFIVLIIGLYLALNPRLYYAGLLRLFPPAQQGRVDHIAQETVAAVRRWLIGRALAMAMVGSGCVLGLWLIGVHFPILLGALAGLLTFIPYLGAIISVIPALLVAGLEGPWSIIYVAALYLTLHSVEAYILVPFIQHRAASIAPAFLLSVQVIGGAAAGILGITLATPIALAFTVIIQLSYVQDIIGEEPHLPSSGLPDET